MSEALTQIHLVDDLDHAFSVAYDLGVEGIGLDVEGVITPYIGNTPDDEIEFTGQVNVESIMSICDQIVSSPSVKLGLMTNNTNSILSGGDFGPCDLVNERLANLGFYSLPYLHRGYVTGRGVELRKKPSGDQGKELARILGIPAPEMVLIDDQGVKNAGEAVKAGFKAIIVPQPIGALNENGVVIEHPGVMRFRKFEPAIYRSLARRGNLAGFALATVARTDMSKIAKFVDHRNAA